MKNGMESFFTREKANNGVEVPLYLPTGEKSEHYVVIRGVDSDVFRTAEAESRRTSMMIAQMDDVTKRDEAIHDTKIKLIAALVMDWSFAEECSLNNVLKFLREAPQIADAIDQVASKRSLFFAQKSNSSQSTPEPSSD